MKLTTSNQFEIVIQANENVPGDYEAALAFADTVLKEFTQADCFVITDDFEQWVQIYLDRYAADAGELLDMYRRDRRKNK